MSTERTALELSLQTGISTSEGMLVTRLPYDLRSRQSDPVKPSMHSQVEMWPEQLPG